MKIKNIFNIIYLEDKIIIGSGSKTVEISPVDNEVENLVRNLEQGINIDTLYEKSAIQKKI